jgi:non-ribosomal peptide synthetase component F
VAARLIAAGVQPGQIVGLWLPRGIELLVLQAGIAKAGAAWLPVDEDTPVERLQVCLDDAAGAGVLTCAALRRAGRCCRPACGRPRRCWRRRCRRTAGAAPRCRPMFRPTSSTPPAPRASQRHPDHPAQHLPLPAQRERGAGRAASDKVYQGFSVAFDMSFEEIWIAYLVGATLWLGQGNQRRSGNAAAHAGAKQRHGAACRADAAGPVQSGGPRPAPD